MMLNRLFHITAKKQNNNIMKNIFLFSCFLSLNAGSLFSQTTEPAKPYIEVTGTSETEITPDEIFITITLQELVVSKEKVTIEKQEEDLKTNLKEIGIEISDLVLNTANADYRRIKTFKKDLVTVKSYILKVSSAEMVDKVYKRLDKINVHDAYISKLSHSKIIDFTKENRIKAIKAAKDKAEYLLIAVYELPGRPISITETDNFVEGTGLNVRGARYLSNAYQSYSSIESGGEEVAIKKIKIRSGFLVRYEIKPPSTPK